MNQTTTLANFAADSRGDLDSALPAQALIDLLSGLQRQAERSGLALTAALIYVAQQAALEELVQRTMLPH